MTERYAEPPLERVEIGLIDTKLLMDFLDREFENWQTQLIKVNNGAFPHSTEVYDAMREYYEQSAYGSPLKEEIIVTAAVIGLEPEFTDDINVADLSMRHNRRSIEFFRGEAFGYAHVLEGLLEQSFDIGQYEGYLKSKLLDQLPRDPNYTISAQWLKQYAEEIYTTGTDTFRMFNSLWQPVLREHRDLLTRGGVNTEVIEAGIGHSIHLIYHGLESHVDSHNHHNRTWHQREFKRKLKSINTIADLGWKE